MADYLSGLSDWPPRKSVSSI